jgi:hypothetical protein
MHIPLKINWNCKALAALASACGVALLLSTLVACSSDPVVDYGMGEYYVELATALGNNDFLIDSGQTLHDSNKTAQRTFSAGSRVYLSFSYNETPDDPITVHGIAPIFSDYLKTATQTVLSQQKKDPIRLESVWIGRHYLNLKFYMEYRSASHKLALLMDEQETPNPEAHLHFAHDKNNDAAGYPTSLYASFRLNDILGEPQGTRTLHIHFNTDKGEKIFTFNY